MKDLSKSDEVLTEHELKQIISSSPRVLKARDISLGHSPEGIQLLILGPIEVNEDKESPKDLPYPHHVEGVALVNMSQLEGHLESLQTDLPTGQDQLLENQKCVLANQKKILAILDRIEQQKK